MIENHWPRKVIVSYNHGGGSYGFAKEQISSGWWAHIEANKYPFGNCRMDRGPYPFKWMAQMAFPIQRWIW